MVNKLTSEQRVLRDARYLEALVKTHHEAKVKLGQISSEIVQSGRFTDRKTAIGYLRKWAKEYEDTPGRVACAKNRP